MGFGYSSKQLINFTFRSSTSRFSPTFKDSMQARNAQSETIQIIIGWS